MNSAAIKKYFESRYKQGVTIRVAPTGVSNQFLITDGHVLLIQPKESAVFNSREMFPVLPSENQTLIYDKRSGQREGPDLFALWVSIVNEEVNPATVTEWCHGGIALTLVYRAFVLTDGSHIFIAEELLTLLTTKNLIELNAYSFFANHPQAPMIVKSGENPIAVLMPKRTDENLKYLKEGR